MTTDFSQITATVQAEIDRATGKVTRPVYFDGTPAPISRGA
jgi:hypothetical protein